MRQGPGIGQGPVNSGGLYTCVGPGGGPGLTRGGPLCPSSTFGLFSLIPGLRQFPVSSSTESPMSHWVAGRRSGC